MINNIKITTDLDPRFQWKILQNHDHDILKSLILRFYSAEEPSSHMVGLKRSEIDAIHLCHFTQRFNHTNRVLIGIFEISSKKLIAAAVDRVGPSVSGANETSDLILPPVGQELLRVWKKREEWMPDFVNKDKVYDMGMLAVDSEFRRMGLATQLTKAREEVAVALDCKYIKVLPSSLFAQKAFESNGFIKCGELSYADYVDPNSGLKLFTIPNPPHTHLRAYYKKI